MNIYLDNNATTPLLPEVKTAIVDFLDLYGNPGSMHETGRAVKAAIDSARYDIATFLGTDAASITFTSSASEANNMVLKSVLFQDFDFTPHVIVSAIEHPCIYNTAQFLAERGVEVSYLPVNSEGIISVEELETMITERTVLVSIMHANNEIGALQPIDAIGKLCRAREIYFHSDMVQSAGKVHFELKNLPVDSASFSAHKMHAPKGIGCLVRNSSSKNRLKIIPLIHGGHQEKNMRAGTENTIGIIAYAAACKALLPSLAEDIARVTEIRDYFETQVANEISDVIINGKFAPRKGDTSNISFKFIEGESILLRLDMEGIRVSTGSACSTGSLDPSHVIMALHDDAESAHGSIRFSFGRENTKEDADKTVAVLKETVSFLRSISPLTR